MTTLLAMFFFDGASEVVPPVNATIFGNTALRGAFDINANLRGSWGLNAPMAGRKP